MMRTYKSLTPGCMALLVAALAPLRAAAYEIPTDNYKYEIGFLLGMSGYLGDANESNMFHDPGFCGGLQGRWLAENGRLAVRASVTAATLSGSTAHWANQLPGGAVYDFNSTVYDVQIRGEFNFFAYGIGETYKRLKRITPYLAVGFGVNIATCDGSTAAAPTVPMAFGVKYKIKPRLNLVAEFSMTKVFGDHVDGRDLSDLYTIKSSIVKNNDWVSTITVGLTWEFGARCRTCHRID